MKASELIRRLQEAIKSEGRDIEVVVSIDAIVPHAVANDTHVDDFEACTGPYHTTTLRGIVVDYSRLKASKEKR